MLSRRSFISKSAWGTVGLTLTPTLNFAATTPQKLTVLHTNDMHSRIDPFPNDGGRNAGKGGMARRAQLINEIRQQEEHVLLLDAGDIFQGTPYFNLFGGELEFKLMSQMKYDAATLGNHDFDNGIKGLMDQLPHAQFPFVIANYDFKSTALDQQFAPYKLFQKGGILVGVFGLGIELQGLVNEKLYGATRYLDPIAVAREMVQELKSAGCDLIICLSHLGYQYRNDRVSDMLLAQQVDGINLIIGGHTHTFLDEPTVVQNAQQESVLVNQVGFGGINLGRIDFTISKGSGKFATKSKTVKVSK